MEKTLQFTKKPVTIEAIQLQKDTLKDVQSFIEGKTVDTGSTRIQSDKWDDYRMICHNQGGILLKTLESDGGTQLASWGDWIIKGVQGEFYPCKPDIFDLTYSQFKPTEGSGKTKQDILNFNIGFTGKYPHLDSMKVRGSTDEIRELIFKCMEEYASQQPPKGEWVKVEDINDILEAGRDFVNKVETGRARSTDSYNKFKSALANYDKSREAKD